jgi:hypothetical protein
LIGGRRWGPRNDCFNLIVCIRIILGSPIFPNNRHGPLQAGHPLIANFGAQVVPRDGSCATSAANITNAKSEQSLTIQWVARLKRAMTVLG